MLTDTATDEAQSLRSAVIGFRDLQQIGTDASEPKLSMRKARLSMVCRACQCGLHGLPLFQTKIPSRCFKFGSQVTDRRPRQSA